MRNVSEHTGVVAKLNPASHSASAHNVGPVALNMGRRYVVLLKTGVLGASATVDVKIQAAVGSGGTYADVPDMALAQIVKATGDGKVAILEVSPEAIVARLPGRTHFRAVVTVGTAASLLDVTILSAHQRYSPAGDFDIEDVVEIKSVVN